MDREKRREKRREEEEEEEKRRKKRRRSKVWNLLSFVWNLNGNYDFGMDYWTFGLLYGIV